MMHLVQNWLPTADTLLSLLSEPQKQWMNSHASVMPQFLNSERGKAALLIYLEEFSDYVGDLMKITQKPESPVETKAVEQETVKK